MAEPIDIGGIRANLLLDTGNIEKGLADARQALDVIGGEVKRLQADFDRGALGIAEYTQRLTALNAVEKDLVQSMNSAYQATTKLNTGLEIVGSQANRMTQAAGGMSKGFGRTGMAMMQVGYIADDLQYGFSGIVNNIAPLVYGLTGNAGVAAGAQIAAVAMNQAYHAGEKLQEAFGDTSRIDKMERSIEGLTARVKELHKELEEGRWFVHTPNVGAAEEAAEEKLRMKQKDKGNADAQRNFTTEAQDKEKKRVNEALGGEQQHKDYTNTIADQLIKERGEAAFLDGEDKAKLDPNKNKDLKAIGAKLVGGILMPGGQHIGAGVNAIHQREIEANAKRLKDLARARAVEEARGMLGAAATNPAAKKDVEDRLRKGGHAKTADVLSGKEMTETEKVKDEKLGKELTEQGHENELAMREEQRKAKEKEEKAKEKKIKDDEKLTRQLNEQGLENQRQGKIEEARHAKEFDREAVEKAKKAIPGIADIAEQTALANRVKQQLGQRIEKSTVKTIEEQLIGEGKMDKKDAHAAAVQLAEKGDRTIGEKIQHKLMMGGETEKVTKSETFAASELANRVQGGVSNENHGKKHTTQFDQMITLLTDMKKNKFFFSET